MRSTSEAALLARIADAWAPRPAVSLADWCSSNLRLPAETSATPGFWDVKRHPYWRAVLDAADDPNVEEIVIMAGTQIGKTTTMLAVLAALSVLQPAPAMLAAPDKDAIKELREKFYGFCEASESLRDTIPAPRLRNDRWMDVGGTRCYLSYAYNTQTLSGKSCRVVLCTEIDRWRQRLTHGDPSLIVGERVKAFHRSLVIRESTPSDENSRIAAAYQASDQRRFLVPCPTCGHFQELRFFTLKKGPYAGFGGVSGLRDEAGDYLSPDGVAESAHYLCEQGHRIESHQKTEMIAQGQWAPKGVTIDRRGQRHGTPGRSPRVAGFRLNSLYSETISFGRMATKWVECRGKQAATQVFWNDWLGAKFSKRGNAPSWRKLGVRLRGTHEFGTVPQWALFLTAAADPGPGYVRWTVRAWGEGSTSALVFYDTTKADGMKRLSHLTGLVPAILEREWKLAAANVLGDTALRVAMLGVDVGYRPHHVHEWWRSLPKDLQRRVRQVAGKAELADGAPWRKRVVEVSARTGKPYPGGQERWEINRSIYSAEVHDRWKVPKLEAGAWMLPNIEPGRMELYLQEITNEAPVRRADARGRMRTFWEKIRKSVGNHYGDCSAYELAVAEMLLDRNWTDLTERLRMRRFGGDGVTKPARFTRPDGRPFVATER